MAETNKTATAMAALRGSDRAPVMAALNKTPVPGDRALRRAMSWRGPQAGIDRGVLPPSTENYDNYNAQVTPPTGLGPCRGTGPNFDSAYRRLEAYHATPHAVL